jgi:DNA-binding XRE family transcriptional regulator
VLIAQADERRWQRQPVLPVLENLAQTIGSVVAPLLPATPLLPTAAGSVIDTETGAMPRPRTVERVSPLGLALQQLRAGLGLSQEGLGSELGVTGMTVHRWELARSRPSPQVLLHIRRYLTRPDIMTVIRSTPELRVTLIRAGLASPTEK